MDSHATLPGILRRIFSKDNPDIVRAQQALVDLQDTGCKPLTWYMKVERWCTPFVHSEICVLEYFYKNNLQFFEGDRYVYCSKPACFTCKLYFAEHPTSMIVPESHGKVYPDWGPPLVEGFKRKDADSDRQRDLMIEITKTVRKEVVNHLWGRSVPPAWHPDSTTGVSALVPSLQGLEQEIFRYEDGNSCIAYASDSGFASIEEEGLLHELDHVAEGRSASSQGSHESENNEFHDENNSDEEGGASL
ncbi:hypothetical protein ISF_10022 [Cordyceps fumosorosea ARSEF 2679]|uniref:Uncharacterized protein n=1 Tax=Cordyceps fumosorosea (strain ARSEF 2679) TaxID=1081104 RepID=A0A166RV37_CORFA|nr:hypothetical protein ISF_10022 [Cordyceps fumosorosea ARSEF 2679]OAA34185.1 hypothetical protein ISF_10022 [Cordyceps fumosorosea ARSEF 2679]